MILLVHPNMKRITDFIMWADVEFAMRLEQLERKKFKLQESSIIDLGKLNRLGDMAAGDPLFVICHGEKHNAKTLLDGYRESWRTLGEHIGGKLPGNIGKIVLFACYAAYGSHGNRPIDLFAGGIATHKKGITIIGYKGATVTNSMGTISARALSTREKGRRQENERAQTGEQRGEFDRYTILVANDSTMRTAGAVASQLRQRYTPQRQFDSYLRARPGAAARDKAIMAAKRSETFYSAFSREFMSKGLYYPVDNHSARPVVVTS